MTLEDICNTSLGQLIDKEHICKDSGNQSDSYRDILVCFKKYKVEVFPNLKRLSNFPMTLEDLWTTSLVQLIDKEHICKESGKSIGQLSRYCSLLF